MRPRLPASALLAVAILHSFISPQASGQQQNEWTWKDSGGNERSLADLDRVLAQHRLWVDSNGKSGTDADLSHADLTGADLRGAYLRGVHFRGTHLSGARLSGADLASADLTDAHLDDAHLDEASLMDAHLTRALLTHAYLPGACLRGTHLVGAHLGDADLAGANLTDADLTAAYLNGANLGDSHLIGADLRGADLRGAQLTGAHLVYARLEGAVFEPKNLPTPVEMARAQSLEKLRYDEDPGPLTQLRKQFQDAGYREQEREITYALNREESNRDSFIERWFRRIAFDWTCRYGLTPGRPLRIVLWLWLLCSFVYVTFIHWGGGSGIYFLASRSLPGKSNVRGKQVRPRAIRAVRAVQKEKVRALGLRQELRLLRAAMFFSLLSAFSTGFRDIAFGRWLRMLTKREYDLKPAGWARPVSGLQSLISVYLIALWVLSYFGRPFG